VTAKKTAAIVVKLLEHLLGHIWSYIGVYSSYRKEGKTQNKLCDVHKTREKERIYLLVQ
jgi:DUF1365 family protein